MFSKQFNNNTYYVIKNNDLCRFDGKSFLTKYRGKKIMFIGDSVSLNQWQSFMCLLHSSVPEARIIEKGGEPITNVTFLVSDLSHHKSSFKFVAKI